MKTEFDLKKYEDMYKTFDVGHNQKHMKNVRHFAVKLAKIYAPKDLEIIYIAATLHDIGLSVSRDLHEDHGYNIIKADRDLEKIYGTEKFELILEAIKEHRASNGNPQSIVAKIVSDADNVSNTSHGALKRAYDYGVEKYPELSHEDQLLESAKHLTERFTNNGKGTRVYFRESKQRLEDTFDPIAKAYNNRDIEKLNRILTNKHSYTL
jgi:HD superfamily phosphodiesterase